MPSTSKQISIANSALLKIGATRINSFDDNKNEAVVVREFYERSYRAMLSMYPWSFAMKTVPLAMLTTTPGAEYAYAFQLPTDLVWLQTTLPVSNFKIVGKQLHTDNRTATIKYVYRVDEEDMSIQFEQAFMYYLASQICIALTENNKKSDSMFIMWKDHLKMAKSLTAQQQPQDGFYDFPVDNSRFGSGMPGGGY